jgi:hypothetical protein
MLIIVDGRVALSSIGTRGDAVMLGEVGHGDWLGELSLIAPGQRLCTATALTPVWAYELRHVDFQRLLGQKPQACIKLLMAICAGLGQAVKAANTEIVELLLAADANAESPNADGETALMLAARTGSVDVASKLIAAGADVNAREAWRDQTALMWASEGAFPELVKLFVEHGADVHARAAANDWGSQITSEPRAQYRPTGGLTALTYAARSGCTDCVRAILAAGESVDRPTPDGVTALMLAIDNYEFDTAKALLDAGANPHVSDWWGRTALYLAVDMNSYRPSEGSAPCGIRRARSTIIRSGPKL